MSGPLGAADYAPSLSADLNGAVSFSGSRHCLYSRQPYRHSRPGAAAGQLTTAGLHPIPARSD